MVVNEHLFCYPIKYNCHTQFEKDRVSLGAYILTTFVRMINMKVRKIVWNKGSQNFANMLEFEGNVGNIIRSERYRNIKWLIRVM